MLLHSLYCYQESSHTADTLLLSRVHHVGSIADCARKPGARSSVYYLALPRTVDGGAPPGPGATLANILYILYNYIIYIYIYIRHPRSHTARLLASLRSAIMRYNMYFTCTFVVRRYVNSTSMEATNQQLANTAPCAASDRPRCLSICAFVWVIS